MPRQPQQVHIYLFRRNQNGVVEYAIFHRADDCDCWQGVCGGVEEGETAEQGARRELFEEAGISESLTLYHLDCMSYLPSNIFFAHTFWGHDVVVVPMYFFAANFDGEITISEEHKEYRWCTYKEAEKLIYWHDQKVALWELDQRIIRGNLHQ